jgi:hypothetical protein
MEQIVKTARTPEEHYASLDEALTNVLRAGKVQVSNEFMTQLMVYERCLRIALGMPVEVNG